MRKLFDSSSRSCVTKDLHHQRKEAAEIHLKFQVMDWCNQLKVGTLKHADQHNNQLNLWPTKVGSHFSPSHFTPPECFMPAPLVVELSFLPTAASILYIQNQGVNAPPQSLWKERDPNSKFRFQWDNLQNRLSVAHFKFCLGSHNLLGSLDKDTT